jgi:acyl carrier protein
MNSQEIQSTLKDYILREFLPGEKPESLTDSTELITRGILDSLATLKLISFVEEKYRVAFAPHETDVEYLNTIDSIAALIASKLR